MGFKARRLQKTAVQLLKQVEAGPAGGITVGDLSRRLRRNRAAIAQSVHRFRQRGWIRRANAAAAIGLEAEYTLTARGAAALARARRAEAL